MRIEAVTAERLDDLADLFSSNAATRGCWCMWFINSAAEVKVGWTNGGNRAAFEAMADGASPPMGLLAYADDGTPVGWLSTGPRSRYQRAIGKRTRILRARDVDEDDDVWLLPCFFVRVGHRREGIPTALLEAAVEHARAAGARAVEGFPIADGNDVSADDYLGKERRFAECGFECVDRPSPRRVVMRRTLD